jgi:hypothetical protein
MYGIILSLSFSVLSYTMIYFSFHINLSIAIILYMETYKEIKGLKSMPKFMQTLDQEVYSKLEEIAKQRGISVQELIRAVIIPEWLKGLKS